MSSIPNSLLAELAGPRRLTQNERWEGAHSLERDLLIPPGVRLTLAPNCRLSTPPGMRPARVFVYGTLEADDADLGGDGALGGLFVQGEGRALLRSTSARFSSQREPGVLVEAKARVEWRGGVLSAANLALSSRGDARLYSLVFGPCGQAVAAEAGSVRLEDCEVLGARDAGVRADAGATVAARGCRFSGSEVGALANGGELALAECSVSGRRAATAVSSGQAALVRCRLEDSPAGLRVDGGQAETDASVFARCEEGARVLGGEARLLDDAFEDCGTGVAVEGGAARVENARVSGCRAAGAALKTGLLDWKGGRVRGGTAGLEADGGRVDCRGALISGARVGLRAARGGTLSARETSVRECPHAGVEVLEAEASLSHTRADDCGTGLLAREARVALENVRVSGGTCAAAVAGGALDWRGGGAFGARDGVSSRGARVRLAGAELEGGERGVSAEGGSLSLSSCAVRRCGVGVEAKDAQAELIHVLAEGCGVAVSARGGSLAWSAGAVYGGTPALRARGAALRLHEISIEGAAQGLELEGTKLDASELYASCPRLAVSLDGGEAELTGGLLEGAKVGVRARAGKVVLSGVAFDGFALGVSCEAGGEASLEGVEFSRCARAFDAGDGRVRVSAGSALAAQAVPLSSSARAALRRLVLGTAARPFARALWRSAYAAGAFAVGLWARLWGASAAWAHRGWTSKDWSPGVSDLDVVALAEGLTLDRLSSARTGLRVLRGLFPFIGEVLVMEPDDARVYASWGGARAGEFGAGGALTGEPPKPTGAAPTPLQSLNECAHALTRLSQWSLSSPSDPWPLSRRQLFKAGLDAARYGRAAKDGGRAPGRSEAWAALTGPMREALVPFRDEAPEPSRREAAVAALAAAVARELEPAGKAVLAAKGPAARGIVPAESASAQARAAAEASVDGWRRALGGAPVAIVADNLHRAAAALDPAALGEGLEKRLEAWLAAARLETAARPLVCGPEFFNAWHWTAYADCPTRWLDRGALSAGAAWPGRALLRWGAEVPAPPEEILLASARESWANLRATWRVVSREADDQPADVLAHHLLGRALGLRLLLERGEARSFYDVDALAKAYGVELPSLPSGQDAASRLGTLYPLVDALLRKPL